MGAERVFPEADEKVSSSNVVNNVVDKDSVESVTI